MINIRSILLIFFSILVGNVWGNEIARYDFQKYTGENSFSFYRIDIDKKNNKGKMCFFNTGTVDVEVSEEISKQLFDGVIWSRLIDLNKVRHACFEFDLYRPDSWFFSPPVKYGAVEFRFFFVGEIKDSRMTGKLYEFRYWHPEYAKAPLKSANWIDIIAIGKNQKN